MKIAVGISSGELGRYAVFYDSLMHVRGVTHDNVIQARSANIAENRNGIAERALTMGFDAVWYVDDDHVFAPQTLERLAAAEKDVVSGLYLKREIPFVPHVYDREDERGWCYPRLLQPLQRGLVSVKAVAAGCLLVKAKVLKALEKPYWRLGQITKDGWGDDLNFCRRVREAGFEVWCDLDTLVGHQMAGTIWPVYRKDGTWGTVLVQGREAIAEWPAAQEKP